MTISAIRQSSHSPIDRVNTARTEGGRAVDLRKNSFLLNQLSSVQGRQTAASNFKKTPSQTHLAHQHLMAEASQHLPADFMAAKLSHNAEPIKFTLGILASHLADNGKSLSKLENICKKLMSAQGNLSDERKIAKDVLPQLRELMGAHGADAFNKYISNFTETCRDAWKQNHTGYGDDVKDETIFNRDILAVQQHLENKIERMLDPNIKWVALVREADYFENGCVAVTKTLATYDGKEPDAAGPQNTPDVPDRGAPEQYSTPGSPGLPGNGNGSGNGPGYGPGIGNGVQPPAININVQGGAGGAGGSATANGGTVNNYGGVPVQPKTVPTNGYDIGVAMANNLPSDPTQLEGFKFLATKLFDHLNGVKNDESVILQTPAESENYSVSTQAETTPAMYLARDSVVSAQIQPETVATNSNADAEINTDAETQADTLLSDLVEDLATELATPPAEDGIYGASRELMRSLSSLSEAMDATPQSVDTVDGDAVFAEQDGVDADGTSLRGGDGANDGIDADNGLSQGNAGADNLSGASSAQSGDGVDGTFANGAQAANSQDDNIGMSSQGLYSSVINQQNVYTQNSVNISGNEPQTAGGRVQEAIREWENRAAEQRGELDRMSAQPGSGLNSPTRAIAGTPDAAQSAIAGTDAGDVVPTTANPSAYQPQVTSDPIEYEAQITADALKNAAIVRNGYNRQGSTADVAKTTLSPIKNAAAANGGNGVAENNTGVNANSGNPDATQNAEENTADADQAPAGGRVKQAVRDWNNRNANQTRKLERMSSQSGSGVNADGINTTGMSSNFGKDAFQPLKGLKGNEGNVYTTVRTINTFNRSPSVTHFNQPTNTGIAGNAGNTNNVGTAGNASPTYGSGSVYTTVRTVNPNNHQNPKVKHFNVPDNGNGE